MNWVKDGKEIDIYKMSDDYIVNCMNKIESSNYVFSNKGGVHDMRPLYEKMKVELKIRQMEKDSEYV